MGTEMGGGEEYARQRVFEKRRSPGTALPSSLFEQKKCRQYNIIYDNREPSKTTGACHPAQAMVSA